MILLFFFLDALHVRPSFPAKRKGITRFFVLLLVSGFHLCWFVITGGSVCVKWILQLTCTDVLSFFFFQGHQQQETARDGFARVEFRQLQSAAAQGAIGRSQQFGRSVSGRPTRWSHPSHPHDTARSQRDERSAFSRCPTRTFVFCIYYSFVLLFFKKSFNFFLFSNFCVGGFKNNRNLSKIITKTKQMTTWRLSPNCPTCAR